MKVLAPRASIRTRPRTRWKAWIMPIARVLASPDRSEPAATELAGSPPSWTKVELRRPLRLVLSPELGRGALDGAWWPYSRDLAREAVDLVDRAPAPFGRIWRVLYSTPDWEPCPRRVKAADTFVSLGSFPHDDTHLVMLKGVASSRVLRLLVVPPEWGERTARHAMRIAATPSNVMSAATILSESVDLLLAGLLFHWDDDGGADVQP